MKTYYFVLLFEGSNRNQDSVIVEHLHEAHLAHIRLMAQNGKLAIAGPFLDDGDLRGIYIFDVGTLDEAKKLVENDPAVRAGRLHFEIRPWMGQGGAKRP